MILAVDLFLFVLASVAGLLVYRALRRSTIFNRVVNDTLGLEPADETAVLIELENTRREVAARATQAEKLSARKLSQAEKLRKQLQ